MPLKKIIASRKTQRRPRLALVTGAGGFIGRHLVQSLLQKGYRVLALDLRFPKPAFPHKEARYLKADLTRGLPKNLVVGPRPEVCFHCAGSASVARSFEDPWGDWQANVAGTARLIEAWRHISPQGVFVFLSSAAVYGNPRRLPIREGDPACPISPYGTHKLVAEHILGSYRDRFGIPVRIARIFSAYGPGLKRQVVHEVVAKARKSMNLSLQGTGRETRDFIHIEDLTRALMQIAQAPRCPQVLNVASGLASTIRDLASTAARLSPRRISVCFSGKVRPGDPRFWKADISRLHSLGFRSKISLQEGLRGMMLQEDAA